MYDNSVFGDTTCCLTDFAKFNGKFKAYGRFYKWVDDTDLIISDMKKVVYVEDFYEGVLTGLYENENGYMELKLEGFGRQIIPNVSNNKTYEINDEIL